VVCLIWLVRFSVSLCKKNGFGFTTLTTVLMCMLVCAHGLSVCVICVIRYIPYGEFFRLGQHMYFKEVFMEFLGRPEW